MVGDFDKLRAKEISRLRRAGFSRKEASAWTRTVPVELWEASFEMVLDPLGFAMPFQKWLARGEKSRLEREKRVINGRLVTVGIVQKEDGSICSYCGQTGTFTNLRGGIECSGCGSPR